MDKEKIKLIIFCCDGYDCYNNNIITITKEQEKLLAWLIKNGFLVENVQFANENETKVFDLTE